MCEDNDDNVNATTNVVRSSETTTGPSSSSTEAVTAVSIPKRKRRPAGTPDPDAEVISVSPKTLLESDRYVCEFCNQGFQREQNLQMHRRRHNVPWRSTVVAAANRPSPEMAVPRRRVYVCPEASCLHHDARHALGDLVGIKKHYRRKHSNSRQFVCGKCSKGYAVHSDYKAHVKVCGTRGHSCECGRVFSRSRVESFIEHQDTCPVKRHKIATDEPQQLISSSTDTNVVSTDVTSPPAAMEPPAATEDNQQQQSGRPLELQLLPPPDDHHNTPCSLSLTIGPSGSDRGNEERVIEQAVAERTEAVLRRRAARRQSELAEAELASAKRIRIAAKAELQRAEMVKEQAARRINALMLDITCRACKHGFSA